MTTFQLQQVTAEDEALLVTIAEGTDDQLAPIVKSVLERSNRAPFSMALDRFIKRKDQEIKSMCNNNYVQFIGSVESLMEVKKELRQFRDSVLDLNREVQVSGSELLDAADTLASLHGERIEVEKSISEIERCRQMLMLVSRAIEQVNLGKYFPALRTLEQLQRQHLSDESNHPLMHQIETQIPSIVSCIRNNVKVQFDTWHSSVVAVTPKLGSLVLQRMSDVIAEENGEDEATLFEKIMMPEFDSKFEVSSEKLDLQKLMQEVKIEMFAVYQCLHIYENLGSIDNFLTLYREARGSLCSTVVNPKSDFQGDDSDTVLHEFFSTIVGFFVVEDVIYRSGNHLHSRAQIEELWEITIARIKVVLLEQIGLCENMERFIKIKQAVVLFCTTMSSLELDSMEIGNLYCNYMGAARSV